MKIYEIVELLDGNVLSGSEHLDKEIDHAFSCDLMSDVLAFARHDSVLLTGLVNTQVIRTAEMLDLKVIVFVRGKTPSEEIMELAKEASIAIVTTKHTMYAASGLLYQTGLSGINLKGE